MDAGESPERWVEVRTRSGDLITVIEVTSPGHKTELGRHRFERKLSGLVHGGVNAMEIDLVYGGLSAKDARPGNWPESEYRVVVNRAHLWGSAELYPMPLREPLPPVRVPLRQGGTDTVLELQPMIDRCYRLGRHGTLDYSEDPGFPLTGRIPPGPTHFSGMQDCGADTGVPITLD